ncbi:AMP-binding protein [Streptomyces cirratus]
MCGGEALPAALAERMRAALGTVWNVYGPTETTVWSTAHELSGPRARARCRSVSALANTRLYVLDERMRPVPVGRVRRTVHRGRRVARGSTAGPD